MTVTHLISFDISLAKLLQKASASLVRRCRNLYSVLSDRPKGRPQVTRVTQTLRIQCRSVQEVRRKATRSQLVRAFRDLASHLSRTSGIKEYLMRRTENRKLWSRNQYIPGNWTLIVHCCRIVSKQIRASVEFGGKRSLLGRPAVMTQIIGKYSPQIQCEGHQGMLLLTSSPCELLEKTSATKWSTSSYLTHIILGHRRVLVPHILRTNVANQLLPAGMFFSVHRHMNQMI